MSFAIYIFITMFFCIFTEVLLGTYGLIIPLGALGILYISLTSGWQPGFLAALFTGLTIDLLYGRSIIVSPFTLTLVCYFSSFWLEKIELNNLLIYTLPAGLAAFIYVFPLLLLSSASLGITFPSLLQDSAALFLAVIISAVLMPFVIIILDSLSRQTGFPQLIDIREKP